ncbi:MAG: MBL fold metallo-hydrolase [Oscillospiraceae bacterium]
MEQIQIRLLGVRGTATRMGTDNRKYGGATSCVLVQLGATSVLLDAGTGLLSLRDYSRATRLHLLLSHPHLDHLAGLPASPLWMEPDTVLSIYAAPHGGRSAEEQVAALLSPPLWPVGAEALPATATFYDLIDPVFSIDGVTVATMEGRHPGGCTVFRLSYGGKSMVYATDFEQDAGGDEALCAFAQNCDLLLCDGEYAPEELADRRGFGHSTWRFAAELGARCGAAQTKIIHHALYRTDGALDAAERALRGQYPACSFARAGEEILL